MITTTEIVQIASLVITSITVYIGISVYRRNKNIELKNQLYKMKLEAFSNIAFEMERLLGFYNRGLVQLKELKKTDDDEELTKLENIYADADRHVYDFSSAIAKHSVYFPEPVIVSLFNISASQFSDIEGDDEIDSAIAIMEKHIEVQVDKMNTAYELIRADLNLSKLNNDLFKK